MRGRGKRESKVRKLPKAPDFSGSIESRGARKAQEYDELRNFSDNFFSSRISSYSNVIDTDKLCNMRINNGHGYHKCKKPGEVFFRMMNSREVFYSVCVDHAVEVRKQALKYAAKIRIIEVTKENILIQEVMSI